MTRAEHLAWCKARALEYADRGDCAGAVASMMSDMSKHPETQLPADVAAMLVAAVMGTDSPAHLRSWVEGFN